MGVTDVALKHSAKTLFGRDAVIWGPFNKPMTPAYLKELTDDIIHHQDWFPPAIINSLREVTELQLKIIDKAHTLNDLELINTIFNNSTNPGELEKLLHTNKSIVSTSKTQLNDEIQKLLKGRQTLFVQMKKIYAPWYEEVSKKLSGLDKISTYWNVLTDVKKYLDYLSQYG